MRILLLTALITAPLAALAQSPSGYYRHPSLHGDTVVFTSEGDLWRVPVSGGAAQRLTTHPGNEAHAAISPDGNKLAFSGEYEGPTDVYVMPMTGGRPRRLTFDGNSTAVVGWTPDGQVLVRTRGYSTLPQEQLMTLNPETADREILPLAQASEGTIAPETRTLFFTRFPFQGSSTKRYQGGWVQNLWRFTPGDSEATPLTSDFPGTSKNPMWWQGRLYYLSDRDGIMNLWSMRPDGSDPRQHTRHRDYDASSASLNEGRIIYQHGADLRLYDTANSSDAAIPITLASDLDHERERWIRKPIDYLTTAHLSPTGDRLVMTARGQVFVAPAEQGRLVEVPRNSGIRYRDAVFLPDGQSLIALSDATGELEFWKLPANGVGSPQPITTNGTVFRFPGVPSPNGHWLAWSDKDLKFWVQDMNQQVTRLIAESRVGPIDQFTWSPDSQWIAYVETAPNTFSQIKLYRVSDGSITTLTSDRVNSFEPAWSPDGKWLYFLSDREVRSLVPSPWGPRQPDPFYTETTRIYLMALTAGLHSPFSPGNELAPEEPRKEKEDSNRKTEDSTSSTNKPPEVVVTIDLDGLTTRLYEVPVPPGNYEGLSLTAKHLFWTARDTGFDAKLNLKQLEITRKEPKPKTLAEDIRSYELSSDRKKLLIRKGDNFHIIASDTSAPAKLEDKVKLDSWTFSIDPREEWQQIFTESWRMMRDYFYDRGMHRLDWPAMLKKYRPLVDRVRDRAELSDAISAMVAELSTLHIFVRYGDQREGPDRIQPAFLGAVLSADRPAGGWRVDHVYRSDPDFPGEQPPLAKPDVAVREGDVILSINGRSTLSVPHPSVLLRNQSGKQVLMEVKPAGSPTNRNVVVQPISTEREADLRYGEWELTRRQRVDELGGGKIGYVHLRAMGTDNIAEWARNFYPVFQRQGLIIDVRHNRGGNIDSWILGKLLRKAWFYWQPRAGDPTWNMHYAFRGHLVVLCNQQTASDGEAFTEGFRRLGLGKVIGTRTWGGEIWLSAQRWLVDRGMATAAEFGVYGPEGAWLIEGHGVDPDIVVDNLPHATFNGSDAQLDEAVKHLQELIERDPRPVPPPPSYPDKTFRAP